MRQLLYSFKFSCTFADDTKLIQQRHPRYAEQYRPSTKVGRGVADGIQHRQMRSDACGISQPAPPLLSWEQWHQRGNRGEVPRSWSTNRSKPHGNVQPQQKTGHLWASSKIQVTLKLYKDLSIILYKRLHIWKIESGLNPDWPRHDVHKESRSLTKTRHIPTRTRHQEALL